MFLVEFIFDIHLRELTEVYIDLVWLSLKLWVSLFRELEEGDQVSFCPGAQ